MRNQNKFLFEYLNKTRTLLTTLVVAVALISGSNFWVDGVRDALASARIKQSLCGDPKASQANAVLERKKVLTAHLAQKFKLDRRYVRNIVELAWRESQRHDKVPFELILAVAQKESSLRATAVSHRGAQGLMQVLARFHPEKLRPGESLSDPRVNIRVGTMILQEYLSAFDSDPYRALAKYSGGARGYANAVLREVENLKDI